MGRADKDDDRQERLAAALRQNLRRRKAAARAREDPGPADAGTKGAEPEREPPGGTDG